MFRLTILNFKNDEERKSLINCIKDTLYRRHGVDISFENGGLKVDNSNEDFNRIINKMEC